MEETTRRGSDDILTIAEELLERFERAHPAPDQPPDAAAPEAPERDCLPCLLADWDAAFDD